MTRLRMGLPLAILALALLPRADAQTSQDALRRLPSLADSVTRPTRLPSLDREALSPPQPPARRQGVATTPPPAHDHHPDRNMRRIPPVKDPVASDPRFRRLPPDNGFGVPDLTTYYRQQMPPPAPPVWLYSDSPPPSPFLFSNFQ